MYVCLVLCFFCGFIIVQFSIPSWLCPFTISPSGSYIHDRYRERKALCRNKSVTVLTKTCQRAGVVCLGARLCVLVQCG